MTKKTKKKTLTGNEMKALELVAKDPTKSNFAIGRKMKELGIVKDDNYLIHRVRNNKVVADKIAIYKESFDLRIARKGKKTSEVFDYHLNNNNLKAATAVARLISGKDDVVIRQPMIHVDTLNIVQNNQLRVLEERRDAIDINDSSDNKSN